MQEPFYNKSETPNYRNPALQKEYIETTTSSKELTQKELNVNQAEQNLLRQRIALMKEFVNDLPASDPQYSMLVAQVQMDQIELDELKIRETLLTQKLDSNF